MLEAKLAGEEIKRPEPVAETPVIDLMEALRRSVAEVQDRKARRRPEAKPRKTKAASSGDAALDEGAGAQERRARHCD